ncbi:MAG: 50S ribosomal protein L3 [Spirochaetaceae bacterium]|nr:MAG: 50S ribosomal protein L3 [Spirochaetaceae bacterium]
MLGLIGQKLGMTQVFDEAGRLVPVTVIKVEPNVVVDLRTPERDGYSAVVLGSFDAKPSRVNKPRLGQFEKAGVSPKKRLVEFRDFENECSVGDSISVELFADVRFVDIVGVSKGKGYQGVMRRHGFHGGRKTHGSKFHRANGSIGMAATPSRVLKGTKMAGRMGGERSTMQNLRVLRVDAEQQLLLVKGAVPGTREGYVLVSTARKKN